MRDATPAMTANDAPERVDRLAQMKPSAIRAIHEFAEQVRRERPEGSFIPLHFGEPDLGTPGFIVEAAVAALHAGHVFYESNAGRADLRAALCEYHRARYDERLTPEHFLVTCGGVQAIALLMLGLLAPGDEVINVSPAWPNFAGAAEIAGAAVHELPLTFDADRHAFRLDFEALERMASGLPRLRMVVVATPANPTGWVASAEEKRRLGAFCRERGLWLIGDEMYDRIVFEDEPYTSFLTLREPEDRLAIINGFSKTYCMTGWRLGYLIADPEVGGKLAQMNEYVTSCAPSMAQVAGITALREGEPFVAEALARYRRLREIVLRHIDAMPGVEYGRPEGSFYCFFRLPASADSVAFCRDLVRETGVILAPGAAFGAGGEGWLRICWAQQPEVLDDAMTRLADFVARRS